MENQIQDTNATPAPVPAAKEYVSDPNAIVAQLQAEAKAKRAAAATVPSPAATVTTEAPTQTTSTQPAGEPAKPTKPDSLQQFRNKDGEVDPAKVEKSNEHLQKLIDDKDARLQSLVKLNKELRATEREKAVEVKATEAQVAQAAPSLLGTLPPELKQKILIDMEKDPVEAIVNLASMIADQKVKSDPSRQEWERSRVEAQEKALVSELDEIGQNGHPWVYSPDGQQVFEQVFRDRPWLLQSRTPYKDAMRFLDPSVSAPQAAAAPAVRSTPTLGGGRAVPPPSSTPTETPEQTLKVLKAQFAEAIHDRNFNSAREIGLKMKKIENGRLR